MKQLSFFKQCSVCQRELLRSCFTRNIQNQDGLESRCRECRRAYQIANYETERIRKKEWGQQNKSRIAENNRQRYLTNREQERQKRRDYHAANKERDNERAKKYRAENPQKVAAILRDWSHRNRERKQELNNLSKKRHPEARIAIENRRRARKKNAEGQYTVDDVRRIYTQQDGRCAYCDSPVSNIYELDHIIPLARGGSNYPDNLAIACPSCNASKRDRLLYTEWTPPKNR